MFSKYTTAAAVAAAATFGSIDDNKMPTFGNAAYAQRVNTSEAGSCCDKPSSPPPSSPSPSTDKDEEKRDPRAKCGVQKVDGNQGLYYAYSNQVSEPAGNRTIIGVFTQSSTGYSKVPGQSQSLSIARVTGDRNLTTLRPNGRTLEQCALDAVDQLIQGGIIRTQQRGLHANTPLG